MKKVFLFACVALMAAMVVSCGEKKKVLEGQTVETEHFSFIQPTDWNDRPTGADKSCVKKIRKGEGKISDMKQISFNVCAKHAPINETDPEAVRNYLVEKRGFESKGDTVINDIKYFRAVKESQHMAMLIAKMESYADHYFEVVVEYCDMNDPEVLDILDNVTIKENPNAATSQAAEAEKKAPEYKAETIECDYFTAELPAGHKTELSDKYGWKGTVFEMKEDGTPKNSGSYVQLIHPTKETAADFIKKQSEVHGNIKPIEKYGTGTYEIGGEKFETWFKAGMVYFLREDTKNGGCYNFACPNFAFEKQEFVMDVFKSVKFK